MPATDPSPLRFATIDVEEYFHIEAARGVIGRQRWGDWPRRVEGNIDRLLSLFDRHNRKGTFFVLGDVARHSPAAVRRIADAGHEIASHGTNHDRLHRLDAASFRDDLLTSKRLLEDLTGKPVIGYRAPTFSLVPPTAWAIDVLVEAGFAYDSSIFPVRHPWYGVPGAPDRPFRVTGGGKGAALLELPPLTWSPSGGRGRKLPVAGGGYFRLLPLTLMKRGLKQAAEQGRPAVLYFHPWEFDPDMPRMPLSLTGRVRTYTGLRSAQRKLDEILAMPGRWMRVVDALDELRGMSEDGEVFRLN
jgi:polysaccharide deacetylase family protein (PEP-CTERM system associated)